MDRSKVAGPSRSKREGKEKAQEVSLVRTKEVKLELEELEVERIRLKARAGYIADELRALDEREEKLLDEL